MMGSTCGKITGVAVLVAGLAMVAGAAGYMSANAATIVAGVLFAAYGAAKLLHKMGCCGMCNGETSRATAKRR